MGLFLRIGMGLLKLKNRIKELTKATIRCIPNDAKEEHGFCVFSGGKISEKSLIRKGLLNFLKKYCRIFKNVVYLHPQSKDYFL